MDPELTTWLDRLQVAVNNGDAVSYYTILSEHDPVYGALGLGVVQRDTFAGVVAHNYAQNKLTQDLTYT